MGREKKEKMEEEENAEEEEEEKQSRSTCLEKPQVLRGLRDVEDGSVAVDLPNLGAQHAFILIELCYHSPGLFRLEIHRNTDQVLCNLYQMPRHIS